MKIVPSRAMARPGRGEQHVFPRRLGRGLGALQRHQQRRDDRGHLDGDPQQRQVTHDRGGQHRPGEQVEPGPEPPRVPPVLRPAVPGGLQVADRVHRHARVHERGGEQEHHAERVDPEKPRPGEIAVGGGRDHGQHQRQAGDPRPGGDQARNPSRQPQRGDRGAGRDGEQQR